MANVCNYRIRVKGRAKDCYAFMCSTNTYDDKWIEYEEGTEKNYTLCFFGNCKWSVDSYTRSGDFDVSTMPDKTLEIQDWCNENKIYEYCMQSRSEMFNVDVWCTTKIEAGYYDEDYERFHYRNGEELSNKRPPSDLVFERPTDRFETIVKYVISDLKYTTGDVNDFPQFDNEEDAKAYTDKLNEKEPYRYAYYTKEEQIDTWL